MHQDKYVFSQLVSFLDWSKFNRIVAEYDGDKYVKFFTCWNQLLAQNRDYYIFEPFVLLHGWTGTKKLKYLHSSI